ncbi:MAG: TetR/AcrR family transcriptional regulator [Bacteroides sp.]|nr:TetR/AcrR family transcriptional regulator [Bacteroides sp.]
MENKYTRKSEKRLIEAVSTIIEKDGFTKVGINHIARIAGCDKVLIYRYFGGLEGLLAAWAKENDFYTSAFDKFYAEIEKVDQNQLRELTKKILLSQLHFLQENKTMQELLLWELSGRSKFKTLQDIRERNGHKLQQLLTDMANVRTEDINLYITVLITSIEFMVLYTRQYPLFNGTNFSKEDSWNRFEKVITNYIDMLFDTFIS